MKKLNLLIAGILIFILACTKNNPEEQLKHISGYWEITKVELKDSVRKYGISQYIDYIELKDSVGFRKKLQPRLDGSYIATNTSETIKVKLEDDSLRLYYSTPFASWKETIIKAEDSLLILKNRNGLIYHYRTYTPILDYGKKE